MKSPKILNQDSSGFTLIEILIVVALFSGILALGAFSNFDTYRLYKFNVEQNTLVSLLNRTRSLSMANFKETSHGIRVDNVNEYVLLPGGETIPRDTGITLELVGAGSLPEDILFDQLSGQTAEITIRLTENNRSRDIEINEEGTINW